MSTRRYGPYSFEASNGEKVFFPDAGITKEELIEYYDKIAKTMLPYLKERPVAMQRFPNGIEGEGFYQKQVPGYFPDWIERQSVTKEEGRVSHVIINNVATLAYLANQGCITPHVWLSRRDKLHYPDRLILDLDPTDEDFSKVRNAALQSRTLFKELDLPVYVMTTGSRGLHLLVPLDRSQSFDRVRDFAQRLVEELAARHPDELTSAMRKKDRGNRVYLDVTSNAYGQHAVAPYAVRPRSSAPVATPLDWDEVCDSSLTADKYTISSIFRRLAQIDEPWLRMQKHAVSFRAAQKTLNQET